VLFVDDDQPEILEWQEKCRTGTGHDPDLSGCRLPPNLFAHARRKVRMPLTWLRSETILESLQEICRKRDFWQQNEHLPALPQSLCNGLEIDFRLAGPRYPVDQGHGESTCPNTLENAVGGFPLRPFEFRLGEVWIRLRHYGRRRQEDRLEDAVAGKSIDDA